MLETKNLVKKYGGKTALNDISFPIEQGKTYLLLGPNGSGKTTWMKTAASLSKPTSGSVLWNGTPVGVESRKEISYMPTESFFYPWMIVADVGDYYADFFEDFDLDRFRDLIRDMELPADAKVKSLSSGMNAKLRLAAAISRKARVYLLDEPLNGIDIVARERTLRAIEENRGSNRTMIVSSHLVDELETMIDDAVFIKDGSLVVAGDAKQLREKHGMSIVDMYMKIYGEGASFNA